MSDPVQELIQEAVIRLKVPGIENPQGDAKRILAHTLGVQKKDLFLVNFSRISSSIVISFFSQIEVRRKLKPVSQIIGYRTFWGRDFLVNEHVLDPRPETEEVIYHALNEEFNSVLDLGTGSGILMITLALERKHIRAVGADISDTALSQANKNIEKFNLCNRIELVQSNWCTNVKSKFDLVVGNPPYIDPEKTDDFHPTLSKWEPEIALFSQDSGVAAYTIIARQLKSVLNSKGVAIFEIGYDQYPKVSNIFKQEGYQTAVFKDLSQKDRVIKVTFK